MKTFNLLDNKVALKSKLDRVMVTTDSDTVIKYSINYGRCTI